MTNKTIHKKLLHLIIALTTITFAAAAQAFHTETHFEDTVKHKIVYQLNKADADYIGSILFSSGELLRKYGDDIHIVIATIGPGLHLLGKNPGRPIPEIHRQRVSSLMSYGVEFQACGNTMKSLKWKTKDLIDGVVVVPIGIDGIMELQEKGYTYISW